MLLLVLLVRALHRLHDVLQLRIQPLAARPRLPCFELMKGTLSGSS
jgi:hypothetical protein